MSRLQSRLGRAVTHASNANRSNSFFTLPERTEILVPLADNTMAMAAFAAESAFLLEVSEKRASSKVAAALKIPDGTIVKSLEQVRGWDNRRVLQSVSWFHPRLKLTGAEDFGKPLYEVLQQKTGITPVHALEEFRAIPANAVLARRLRIKKGGPLLLRVRTTIDANDLPIDYAEIHYQTGDISLTLDSRWRPVDQA
jgi:DNA-binding GntR family transcriptional regulator